MKFAQLSGETRFSWFLPRVSFPKCLLTPRTGVCCSTVSRTILVSSVLVMTGWKIFNPLLAKNIWGVATLLHFPCLHPPLFHLCILLCVYVFFIYRGEKYSQIGYVVASTCHNFVFFIGKCVFLANVQTEDIAIFISSHVCYQIRWRDYFVCLKCVWCFVVMAKIMRLRLY